MSFVPAARYRPRDASEVVECLRRHRGERVRCMGARHSWSRMLATDGVLLDLRRLDQVEIDAAAMCVRVGGGCTLRRLLRELGPRGLTLPTLGVITRQSVAGAISTGTHGSGAQSLSHFVEEVSVATLDGVTPLRSGADLLAARCALGALGPIVEAVLRVRPAYRIEERFGKARSLDEVLAPRVEWPLQQFALFPWSWSYAVYRRRMADRPGSRLWAALMRWRLFLLIDVLLHLMVCALARLDGRAIRAFYRKVLPWLVWPHCRIDDCEAVLTLRHDLFRHVEMELFVPEAGLEAAIASLREIVEIAAGERDDCSAALAPMRAELLALRGTWTHHYPLFFRKVLPEETLVSMASPGGEGAGPWMSIGIFTYRGADKAFTRFAAALARCVAELHGARLHWGKYFPLPLEAARRGYPRFDEFEAICRRHDPAQAFWSPNL